MNAENVRSNWDLRKDEGMVQAIRHARLPLCITDPTLPDNPIVFTNQAFSDLTGYDPDEVIGKNCRFLQGEETTPASIAAIRNVLECQTIDTVEILNYRKDGSTFLNALQVGPIFDDNGKLVFFFGSQLDISAKREAQREAHELADRELLHRLRNIVNVMTVIIRMTAREESEAVALSQKVVGRLTALSEAHFDTIVRPTNATPAIRELAQSILAAYAPFGERQFRMSGPDQALPAALITPITLTLHELSTNAVKHGALSHKSGVVELDWSVHDQEGEATIKLKWEERNGPTVVAPKRQSGSSIIATLVAASGGTIDFDWRPGGLIVTTLFRVLR